MLVGSSGYAMKRAQATSHRGSLRLSDFTVLIKYHRVARRLGYISSDSGYPGTIVLSCLRSPVEYAEWGLPVATDNFLEAGLGDERGARAAGRSRCPRLDHSSAGDGANDAAGVW